VTHRNGRRDQDLALALARLEAAFEPVEVLEVRPNPRPASQLCLKGNGARHQTAQGILDLDADQGGEAVA
jgi:hypothetical protein